MQGPPEPIDATDREQLAKAWLMRLVEHTSLRDVGDLSLSWLASEAPPLIADVLADAAQPAADRPSSPNGAERRSSYADVARLRGGPEAATDLPRDLAALQSLLIAALGRRLGGTDAGEFTGAVRRLAEVFGTIQSEAAGALVERGAAGGHRDELTGLPGARELEESLRALLAEHRRYRHPFAIALIDVDGLDRVNDAYGSEAGDSMLTTVAGVIRRQIRSADRAFRLDQDELCVVAPHTDPEGLVTMAERLSGLLASSQLPEGPRVAITAGLAGCPRDGDTTESLLDAAQEAVYAAKAAGRGVAVASPRAQAALQDR